MLISQPRIEKPGSDTVRIVATVDWKHGESQLWYEVPRVHAELVSLSCDAQLLALLMPAMYAGEKEIVVQGRVSERLWHSLQGPYQTLLQEMMPSLNRIDIKPANFYAKRDAASGIATGFSAGIDSFCTLVDYRRNDGKGMKLTTLLFNNVGAHVGRGRELFKERLAAVRPLAERIGLPLVTIDSNVSEFYDWDPGFFLSNTPRNASAALLLQEGIGTWLYSSAYRFSNCRISKVKTIGYTDSIGVPLLSTEGMAAIAAGHEYTRVEKTLRVAEAPESYWGLDVCTEDRAGNCSECSKCLRTMLTLEIAGYLERYTNVFKLERYARMRSYFIAQMLSSRDPLMLEIAQFSRERDFKGPLSSRVSAALGGPNSVGHRVLRMPFKLFRGM